MVDRGYKNTIIKDFLSVTKEDIPDVCDMITNPPYIAATEFAEHALNLVADGSKVAMLLKIQFLETQKRYALFRKFPPKVVYVFVDRIACGKNGLFEDDSSAVCYCWFVWKKGYTGDPVIRWIGDVRNKSLF